MRTEFRIFYQSRVTERWAEAVRVPLPDRDTAIDAADALGKALGLPIVVNEVLLDAAGENVRETQIHEWRP